MDIFFVVAIILVSGVFGGVVNYLIQRKAASCDKKFDADNLKSCIVYGLAASSLMPLFLQTISSNLLSDNSKLPYSYLVFFGFCLVASISSMRFISGVSLKVLAELEGVKAVQAESQEKLKIVESETQKDKQLINKIDSEFKNVRDLLKDEEENDLESSDAITVTKGILKFDEEQYLVMATMKSKEYVYRSISSMSMDSGIEENRVKEIVNILLNNSFIDVVKDEDGERFYLLEAGSQELDAYKQYYISELPLEVQEAISIGIEKMPIKCKSTLAKIVGDVWVDYDRRTRNQMGRVFRYLVAENRYPMLREVQGMNQQRHKEYERI